MATPGQDRIRRRLAAILAADVAGYSRLTGLDEEGTLKRLRRLRRELINPAVSLHRGRIGDPVRAGLAQSLSQPGGNITGNTILGPEVVAKRLEVFKEAIPTIARVALLWNPDNASNRLNVEEIRVAAPVLRMAFISVPVRRSEEFDGAFAEMMREHPDGLLVTADPLQQLHIGRIIDLLAKNRLPAMFQVKENVVAGGLMSYGASLPDLFRRGAGYVHKILQGTKPADLPVEQPTKFELVINLKTAKALGLIIPPTLLARADEVIE